MTDSISLLTVENPIITNSETSKVTNLRTPSRHNTIPTKMDDSSFYYRCRKCRCPRICPLYRPIQARVGKKASFFRTTSRLTRHLTTSSSIVNDGPLAPREDMAISYRDSEDGLFDEDIDEEARNSHRHAAVRGANSTPHSFPCPTLMLAPAPTPVLIANHNSRHY